MCELIEILKYFLYNEIMIRFEFTADNSGTFDKTEYFDGFWVFEIKTF